MYIQSRNCSQRECEDNRFLGWIKANNRMYVVQLRKAVEANKDRIKKQRRSVCSAYALIYCGIDFIENEAYCKLFTLLHSAMWMLKSAN